MTAPLILSRSDWGARAPKRSPIIIKADKRKGLVAHHNGPKMSIDTSQPIPQMIEVEKRKVLAVQAWHQRNWSDEAYSYFIGQSGTLFIGRGEEWDQFANGDDRVGPDDGTDREWYTVMFLIGWDPQTGDEELPTEAAIETFRWLISHLREAGSGDRVLPHSDFRVKRCPGYAVRDLCRLYDNQPLEDDVTIPPIAERYRMIHPAMKAGRAHPFIEDVQYHLNILLAADALEGDTLEEDSIPGPLTIAVAKEFETQLGHRNPDGFIGRTSWPALLEAVKRLATTDDSATVAELQKSLFRANASLRVIRQEADEALGG